MKININKKIIKKELLKILQKLSQNLFLVLVFLLVLDLIIGGLFFWKYYLKAQAREIMLPPVLKINQALLNKFSSQYLKREKIFQAAETKQYPDPFQGIIIEEVSEPEE